MSLSARGNRRDFLKYAVGTGVAALAAREVILQTRAQELARQADGSGVTAFTGGPGASDSFASLVSGSRGDILRRNSDAWERLGIGASGRYLRSDGSDASWAALALADFPGGINEQFLRGDGATSPPVYEAVPVKAAGAVLSPTVRNINFFEAQFPLTVTGVRARRTGGTGATVNARRNGASNHLASDLSLTTTNWTSGGAVQNTAYVAGDNLQIMIVSVAGSPTEVAIQVDFTRP